MAWHIFRIIEEPRKILCLLNEKQYPIPHRVIEHVDPLPVLDCNTV